MVSDLELAVLAYRSYRPSDSNDVTAVNWVETLVRDDPSSGFAASVYTNGDEVVIAFRGTNTPLWRDFLYGNIPAARGGLSAQIAEAIKLVADARNANPGKTITLTGHSLGGGVASVMATFFDLKAVVFDPAPFGLTAQSKFIPTPSVNGVPVPVPVILPSKRVSQYFQEYQARQVRLNRTVDNNFGQYSANYSTLYAQRKERVTGYYVPGEVLGVLSLPVIVESGGLKPLDIGLTTLNDDAIDMTDLSGNGVTLHNMSLLLAMMASPSLRTASAQLPTLLEVLRTDNKYVLDSTSDTPDLLTRMIKDQVVNGVAIPGKALDRFAVDVLSLAGVDGVAQTNAALRDALIMFAMDYYYYKDLTATTSAFTTSNGGIHFKYSDIGAPAGTEFISLPQLVDAVASTLTPDEQARAAGLASRNAWHIQSGINPLLWVANANDPQNDAAVGGTGNDSIDAGAGNDILIGGAGNDSLAGGAGLDTLIGGADNDTLDGGTNVDWLIGGDGQDTYNFSGDWGSDVIEDSDANGIVKIDGVQIKGAGAKRIGTSNFWQTDEGAIRYTVVQVDASRTDLIINFNGVSHGTITIRNWIDGRFGISLGSEVAQDPTNTVYLGDFGKATSGGSYLTSPTGYVSGGALPDAADVINGTSGKDTLRGFGGSDGLAGGAGDDLIEGGTGADLLLGGLGVDTINGGDGDDHIFGSASGFIDRPTSTTFTPPASSGVELARGFSWVIYNPPGLDANGRDPYLIVGASNILPNGEIDGNIIDGGAGNDWIYAGTGNDVVHGGLDIDTIWGMGQSDVLFGDEGNDIIFGDGSPWFDGAYTPLVEHGDDILHGGSGLDTLVGQGGNDQLFGGADDDQMFGDDSDLVRTPATVHGRDEMYGGAGNDTLTGGGGDDVLAGGSGNDTLIGDQSGLAAEYHGTDWLYGDAGNDFLDGNGGDDHLFGGDDNDTLQGDSPDIPGDQQGDDYLDGGAGNDILIGAGGADTLLGGDNDDQLFGDADNVAEAYQGNDVLDGGAGNDQLQGYAGDDTLHGGADNDTLYGGKGNDTLTGGTGVDFMDGEEGDDTFVFETGDALISSTNVTDTVVDAVGNNVVQINGVASTAVNLELSADGQALVLKYGANEGVAVLLGSSVSFRLSDGTFSFNELIGSRAGGNVSYTDGVNTYLLGGTADDSLSSTGSSTISGGFGNDTLSGTGGSNTYLYSIGDGTDHINDTSAKTDGEGNPTPNTLSFGAGVFASDLRLGVGSNALTISVGWDPDDLIYVEGFDPSDALATHPVDRFVFADGVTLTYQDLLLRGFDIEGTVGDDTLTGTSVDDRITGGAGNDQLSGGTGSDTYYWGVGAGQDTVNNVDASSGKMDTLRIEGGLTPSELIFSRNGNDLLVRIRTSGDSVTITNHFNGAAIDLVAFDDGTLWDQTVISANLTSELTNGNDVFTGTSSDDFIAGLGGNDTISGSAGDDLIEGGDGDDTLNGDAGDDTLSGGAGVDSLKGGTGGDTYLFGRGAGADQVTEVGDARTVDVIRLAADITVTDVTLSRATNDLVIRINGTNDKLTVVGAWAIGSGTAQRVERIEFADGTVWTEAAIRQRVLQDSATDSYDSIVGFDGADLMHGGGSNDTLRGGDGADTMYGDGGDDYLYGQNGDDVLVGGQGNDWLYGGPGSDTFVFGRNSGMDILYSDDSDPTSVDRIEFATDISRADVRFSHSDDDLWFAINGLDGSTYNSFHNLPQFFTNNGAASLDEIRFADGTVLTYGNIRALMLAASDGADSIVGFSTGDTISGLGGDDSIDGAAGNDVLMGDAGDDQLNGGDGNDTLYGGTGVDKLTGGLGDDVYRWGRGDGKDTIQEASGTGSGFDTLELAAGILPANVALYRNGYDLVVVLDGSSTQLTVANFFGGTPNQIEQIRFADATIWDLAAINARVISGTVNSMTGTAVNDIFVVDNALDTITEGANQGTDTVVSSVDWTLGANLENLTLSGVLNINGTGNSLANVIIGNDGDNKLGSPADSFVDTLRGGKGDDTYYPDSSDVVVEMVGEGVDTIVSDYSYTLPADVENLVYSGKWSWISGGVRLTGNALNNVINGRLYPNAIQIDGGPGADTLMGSLSALSRYNVDNPGDVVIDQGSGLSGDVVSTTVDYALPAGIERLDLAAGSAAAVGTGNELNNVIRGNEHDNLLYGLGGNDVFYSGWGVDTLIGGRGNDVYYLDWWVSIAVDDWLNPIAYPYSNPYGIPAQVPSTVVELGGEGTDSVYSGFDYTLPDNVEQLFLLENGVLGPVVRGTGNALGNLLVGNSLDNVLDGGAGADTLRGAAGDDTLIGGTGDDTYFIDSGDSVIEYAGEGIDTIVVGYSYVLQAEFENLTLTGAGNDTGTGSAIDNVLDGTQSAGSNQLIGGLGNDIYRLGAGDVAVEVAGQGTDTVESLVDHTLGNSIERLVLIGSGAISGTGSAGADVLDGSRNAAANVLTGLAGDDAYVVDSLDVVAEAAGGGTDTVTSIGSYTLSPDIERLILTGLTGIENLNGTGNALDNLLVGNGGDNVLDGAGGADTLRGGDGNDSYVVDAAGDIVDETGTTNSSGDEVISSISYTLGANVERLRLAGSAAISGTGNALDNRLDGSLNSAANTLAGGQGNDTYVVGAGDVIVENAGEGVDLVLSDVSYVLSANVENLTLTGLAASSGTGNSLINVLTGNAAENVLDGRGGADTLIGGLSDDTYVVDSVDDLIVENAGEGTDLVLSSVTYTLSATVEYLTLTGSAAIAGTGNALDNQLDGSLNAAVNTLIGGLGDDTYVVGIGDILVENAGEGTDLVESAATYTLADNFEKLTLTGSSAANGTGNGLANILTGNRADNVLDGAIGADQMSGGLGNDTYVVDNVGDVVLELAGEGTDLVQSSVTYTLSATVENLTLTGTSAINGTGNALDNVLTGNAAVNTLTGGAGNDTYVVSTGDTVTEAASAGSDTVRADVSWTLGANLENLTLIGNGAIDGTGNTLANVLIGNAAANVLNGGTGADQMLGGLGDDTFVVDNAGDVVTETAGQGTDLVQAGLTYALTANVENLTLTGTGATNGTGNDLGNVLTGNSGANVLDGGTGADTLVGAAGNDTYVVDNVGDVIVENASQGTDLVQSSVSYALSANVENLTLIGTGAINGTGNVLDNVLTGNSAANTLTGGLGNDTYVVDNAGDVVIEGAGEGTDLVQSSVTHTLSGNVENLTLTGTSAINGTGNALANVLTGNGADNVLDGGAGADSLVGGAGNDTYYVSTGDTVTEGAGAGTDVVFTDVTWTLAANVENLTLFGVAAISGTGNTLANVITGNSGANILDGGTGADQLAGGLGDDTYVVDNAGDVVTELAGEGTDLVQSSVAYILSATIENLTLTGTTAIAGTGNALDNRIDGAQNTAANTLAGGLGSDTYIVGTGDVIVENAGEGTDLVQSAVTYALAANLENLTLTGAAAINATGNTQSNVLTGNSAANVLDGGIGADTLVGAAGNDTYVVDNAGDVVIEGAGEGTDLVQSSVTYTLSANVENLTLTGTSAINAIGNDLANVLTGNGADNVLDGGAGADSLIGGVGNDTYYVSTGDTVTEGASAGTDTVVSDVSWTLGANLENLTLTGTAAIDGTGNTLANILVGNSAANVLNGGTGTDQMSGGQGNDTYVVDATGDVVVENAGEGTDLVQSSVTYSLLANVENLTLTGTTAINGTGNALDNVLTGNSAANTLTGGLGNDTYVIGTGDSVVENAGEGTDLVQSSITYTLLANCENLTLTGTAAINGTGNAVANALTGNSAINVLDGGAGADTLAGGAGNDTYVVDNVGDVVTENAGEGTDLVQSGVTYALSANVENLTLTGTAAINGTGNALDNVLTGNSAVNTLVGGAGNDTYVVTAGDVVTENVNEGIDLVQSGVTYVLSANVENLTLTGTTAINGTGNALDNVLTGNSAANTLTGGLGNDTYVIGTGDSVVENAGEGTDLVQSSITYTLLANCENLTLTGTAAINGTGNAVANVLTGNSGINVLDGGAGADTLAGGAGNDTYVVDNAADVVVENAGEGTDLVQSSITYTLLANFENLTLTGTTAINGTGNSLDNVLTGNSAANVLTGGLGNDTYVVGAGDVAVENAGEGTDLVQSSVTYTLSANVENLTLTGTTAINGTGNALDNVLTGNSAANTLTGGLGNDTYVIGTGDSVVENAGEGTDLVQSSITYTLLANCENLTLTGTAAINGTGNAVANVLTGNSGINVLDGGAGADTLAGGAGNDTYVVDDVGDVVTEGAGAGTDLVQSGVTYALSANVENLTLTGSAAINGTGNALDNVLTGNSAVNTLVGGLGNDTYVIGAGDIVVENAGEGTDAVQSSVTYGLLANFENLTLTGTTAINGTGNALDNVLTGNSSANTLTGGLGNDTYVIGAGDVVVESAGEGTDLVQSDVTHTLATNVENLTLTGTAAINGAGNDANNILTGNSAANVLTGGLGNDTYVVGTGDTVVENVDAGTDLVQSAVTHTLSGNVEHLTLTGTSAINGTGNALDNVLTGNSGSNTLTGGTGNDTLDGGSAGTDVLVGGLGNDTYVVARTTGITITENANEGIDAVSASVTHTLGANIELLFQTGSTAINGTGNALSNLLRGNTGVNTLTGGGGTDILEGGAGNDILSNTSGNTLLNGGAGTDTLTGTASNDLLIGGIGNDALATGLGADLIVFNKGDGVDTVAASTTTDNTLSIGGGTLYADLVFQKSGLDLILKIGAADQITFVGYYSGSNRSVNTLQVVIEGTADYLPGGGDTTRDNKIETFNFGGLVAAFDAALIATPGLTSWALTNALATQYLSGSDTAAIGGDLAYRYNRFGTLSDVSFTPAVGILGAAGFGTSAQSLQSLGSLQDATPRLS